MYAEMISIGQIYIIVGRPKLIIVTCDMLGIFCYKLVTMPVQ